MYVPEITWLKAIEVCHKQIWVCLTSFSSCSCLYVCFSGWLTWKRRNTRCFCSVSVSPHTHTHTVMCSASAEDTHFAAECFDAQSFSEWQCWSCYDVLVSSTPVSPLYPGARSRPVKIKAPSSLPWQLHRIGWIIYKQYICWPGSWVEPHLSRFHWIQEKWLIHVPISWFWMTKSYLIIFFPIHLGAKLGAYVFMCRNAQRGRMSSLGWHHLRIPFTLTTVSMAIRQAGLWELLLFSQRAARLHTYGV